jgi:hypothetical protein
VKTRKCVDENKCGTDFDKPFESQPCTAEEIEQQGTVLGFISGMTATLTENAAYVVGGLLVIIVLLVLGRKRVTGFLNIGQTKQKGTAKKVSSKK